MFEYGTLVELASSARSGGKNVNEGSLPVQLAASAVEIVQPVAAVVASPPSTLTVAASGDVVAADGALELEQLADATRGPKTNRAVKPTTRRTVMTAGV